MTMPERPRFVCWTTASSLAVPIPAHLNIELVLRPFPDKDEILQYGAVVIAIDSDTALDRVVRDVELAVQNKKPVIVHNPDCISLPKIMGLEGNYQSLTDGLTFLLRRYLSIHNQPASAPALTRV